MKTINIDHPEGYLYIVSDSHLDQELAPYEEFIEMLDHLEDPHTLICLGDLFKVWLALPQFWSPFHRKVMEAFQQLRQKGVQVIFVVGNRELLLPRSYSAHGKNYFPFTHLFHHDCYLQWGTRLYGFAHGDAINRKDSNYLRWKAFSHSLPFEWAFRVMPALLANKISLKVEALLAGTNQTYKMSFPEEEMIEYARQVLPQVDHFFIGHFHTDRTITLPDFPSVLSVVPDWLSQRVVLQIDDRGTLAKLNFKGSPL
ncbi:metallophosphoesterase [Deltaproteobacteria bacterium TL4]